MILAFGSLTFDYLLVTCVAGGISHVHRQLTIWPANAGFFSHCSLSFNRMTSTPDSISMSELLSLAENAREEENNCVLSPDTSDDERIICDMPVDEYQEAVIKALEELGDRYSHPMTAKLIIMECLSHLMQWHTNIGQHHVEDDELECGTAWLRDAGKLQAAMCIMHSVDLPDDFIAHPVRN